MSLISPPLSMSIPLNGDFAVSEYSFAITYSAFCPAFSASVLDKIYRA